MQLQIFTGRFQQLEIVVLQDEGDSRCTAVIEGVIHLDLLGIRDIPGQFPQPLSRRASTHIPHLRRRKRHNGKHIFGASTRIPPLNNLATALPRAARARGYLFHQCFLGVLQLLQYLQGTLKGRADGQVNTDVDLFILHLGEEKELHPTGGKQAHRNNETRDEHHGGGVAPTQALFQEGAVMVVGEVDDGVGKILLPQFPALQVFAGLDMAQVHRQDKKGFDQ